MALLTFLVVMVGPAKAMEPFPWWNVRLFDGIYYLVDHNSGWQEQLETWEVMSLEEAMQADPEMAIYIHGHSNLGSGTTQHPPVWNAQARQWLMSLQPPGPNDHMALSLDLPLLYMRVEEKQREQERKNEEARWQACKGSRSQGWQPYSWWDWEEGMGGGSTPSSSSTGYTGPGTWEPEEGWNPWHPKWNNERYYTRGWGSACKRHQRRACEQRGEPVPDHLLPKKIELAKGFKKEMMELVKKSKKVAEASSDSEMPEAGKKAEPEKAPSPEEDDESSSSWSYNPKPNRRSDSPMPGKHGPRWKGTPRTVAKVPVGDKQELEVEKYLKSRIKEEEEEDDDEEDSEEPEKAKKKKKKRRRKSRKPEKGGVKPDGPGDGHGGAGGGGGGGAGEGPAAVTAAA